MQYSMHNHNKNVIFPSNPNNLMHKIKELIFIACKKIRLKTEKVKIMAKNYECLHLPGCLRTNQRDLSKDSYLQISTSSLSQCCQILTFQTLVLQIILQTRMQWAVN